MQVSDNTKVEMPLRNIIGIIGTVAICTWAYSGVIERINRIETQQVISQSEIKSNSEFRISWPRGEMGSLPDDAKQDMKIESLERQIADINEDIERNSSWIHNFEPPKNVQEAIMKVTELQIRIKVLEAQIEQMRSERNAN